MLNFPVQQKTMTGGPNCVVFGLDCLNEILPKENKHQTVIMNNRA